MGQLDSSFKRTSGRDSRGILTMLRRIEPGEEVEIAPFEREIVPTHKTADAVFAVTDASGRVRYEQLEALARWHAREPKAIALRSGALLLLDELDDADLNVTVVLLNPEAVPAELPREFRRGRGSVATTIVPRYERMWEMDGDALARSAWSNLLPWVPLMRTSEAALLETARRIADLEDDELSCQFVTLGSVRYDKDYLRDLLGRFGSVFTTKLAAETPFGKELIEKGIERGVEKGRREEAARSLRLFLKARFPALAGRPEVDRVGQAPDPDAILDMVYRAEDEDTAWAAIAAAGSAQGDRSH